jgi:membrane-associated protease RseP (regulator of RpoE activity)
MKTIVCRAAAVGLMALLGTGAGAWALPGDDSKDEKKVEKRRIVIVGPDGKEKVIEGLGPMVRRGYLGVGLTELTPELRTHFGAPESAGVMVSSVEPGSPADKAGLEVGDILARIDGKEVKSSWDVRSRVRDFEEGQQVPLEVWRDRKVQTLTAAVSLRERPELDMGPLLMRHGDGEDGPLMFRFNQELGGMPERIELPPPGAPGAGPGELRVRTHRSPRERQLELRLQELEKRIAEMEKQLEKKRR